jgi:UDP-2,3-diacylglucosamine hydrolase
MILVIADLHLDGKTPAATRLLLDFLQGPARKARALYILGDLFEAWIGDDAPLPPADDVADGLRELAAAGVEIVFLVGNRDFLLHEEYCRQAAMRRVEEPVSLAVDGKRLILMHGDVLCTDDEDYQAFRAKVRRPEWQQRMLARPAWLRRQLARLARFISKRRNRGKPAFIMDVNSEAVQATMKEWGAENLIHGHTHRPAIHRLEVDGNAGLRAVLGDWHADRGSAIRVDRGGLSLLELSRDGKNALELRVVDQAALV